MRYDLPLDARTQLDELLLKAASSDDPYAVGPLVLGLAQDAMADSLVACRLFDVWSSLTDYIELWPDQEAHAQELIRRAASEWRTLDDGESCLDAYFDRWDAELEKTFVALGPSPLLPLRWQPRHKQTEGPTAAG